MGRRRPDIIRLKALILALTCMGTSSPLFAAAWTQDAGHGQLILTTSYFDTSQQFGPTGGVTPFGYGGQFRQIEINPYFEYGLTNSTTLIVNSFIPMLRFSNNYGSNSSFGFGDLEIGARRRLNSRHSPWVVSVQSTVQFPTYSAYRNPAPGNHQVDAEARVLLGHGYRVMNERRDAFWDVETAFRYRNGGPSDQVRLDATAGLNLTSRVMVEAQFFGIKGLRNGTPFQDGTNPNVQADFDLYKGQASMVFRVAPRTRLQLGWNDAFAGRNTGTGQTALVALWLDF